LKSKTTRKFFNFIQYFDDMPFIMGKLTSSVLLPVLPAVKKLPIPREANLADRLEACKQPAGLPLADADSKAFHENASMKARDRRRQVDAQP
jgi:hypothetical protein